MNTYLNFHAIAEESVRVFPASNLYFLLDHSGLPGLYQQLLKSSSAWVSIFDGTAEASEVGVAPILILVGSNGRLHVARSLLEWIGQKATYTSTVIMLSSPLLIDSLRSRLRARLDVKLSENMDAMLRFFDPRVLESLVNTLSVDQLNSFFGVAETWKYVDRAGKLREIRSDFNFTDKFSAPLVLAADQEFDLVDASEIDQVLNLIRENAPAVMAEIPTCGQYDFVKQKVEVAKKCGLDTILKYMLYIVVPIIEGGNFAVEENWTCFVEKLKGNDFEFSESFV